MSEYFSGEPLGGSAPCGVLNLDSIGHRGEFNGMSAPARVVLDWQRPSTRAVACHLRRAPVVSTEITWSRCPIAIAM